MKSRSFLIDSTLFFVILAAALYPRFPYFSSPYSFNSDHAIVALQARRLLKGEWSWFLWGCDYQASFESILTAIFFRLFGESEKSFFWVGFTGFSIALGFIYLTLLEMLQSRLAFLLVLLIAIGTEPLVNQSLYPPRIWAMSAIFGSLFLFLRKNFFVGNILFFLSCYIDFIAVEYLPAVFVFGLMQLWINKDAIRKWILGFFLGGAFLLGTRFLGPKGGAPLSIHFQTFVKNAGLLWDTCLERLLGLTPYSHLAAIGAAILLFLVLWAMLQLLKKKDLPSIQLFITGVLLVITPTLGFLLNPIAFDSHAVRYLTPIIWAIPFLLAPLAKAPWRLPVCSALTILFFSFFFTVNRSLDFFLPLRTDYDDAMKLVHYLEEKNVKYGKAHFWVSYRFNFLAREAVILTPFDPATSRYLPYDDAANKEEVLAAVFLSPQDPIERINAETSALLKTRKKIESFQMGAYSGFLYQNIEKTY